MPEELIPLLEIAFRETWTYLPWYILVVTLAIIALAWKRWRLVTTVAFWYALAVATVGFLTSTLWVINVYLKWIDIPTGYGTLHQKLYYGIRDPLITLTGYFTLGWEISRRFVTILETQDQRTQKLTTVIRTILTWGLLAIVLSYALGVTKTPTPDSGHWAEMNRWSETGNLWGRLIYWIEKVVSGEVFRPATGSLLLFLPWAVAARTPLSRQVKSDSVNALLIGGAISLVLRPTFLNLRKVSEFLYIWSGIVLGWLSGVSPTP